MDDGEVADLDAGGRYRGGMDRSTYIRWLVQQDKKRIANERAISKSMQVPVFPLGQTFDPYKEDPK